MNHPRLRPSLALGKIEIPQDGLQKKSDILWVQGDQARPCLEHDVHRVEVAVARDLLEKEPRFRRKVVRRHLSHQVNNNYCNFDQDGKCTVNSIAPNSCRILASTISAYCSPNDPEMFSELDRTMSSNARDARTTEL